MLQLKITDLTADFANQSFDLDIVGYQVQTAAGITDLSDVRIKFQQYDNWPASGAQNGRYFDDIRVT